MRKDGEVIWIEAEVSRFYFEGEKGLLTILSDITERKQTEVMLRRLSNVVEQTDDPVVVTDVDGTIQYVNPATERITGYTAAEMLGQNPRILKSRGKAGEVLQAALGTDPRRPDLSRRVR